jgi:hypothetical protein
MQKGLFQQALNSDYRSLSERIMTALPEPLANSQYLLLLLLFVLLLIGMVDAFKKRQFVLLILGVISILFWLFIIYMAIFPMVRI